MADDKKKENPDIARLQAKVAAAKNPTQKASLQFQLDVLKAGSDKAAVAKIRAGHSGEKAAAAKAKTETKKKATAA